VNGNHWETWNTSGTRLQNAFNFNGHMGLKNNWDVHLGNTLGNITPSYCDRCTRGGPVLRQSFSYSGWGGVNTDSRRIVSSGLWLNGWLGDEGKSDGWSLNPYVNFRFSTQFQLSVGPNVSRDHNNTQWYSNFTEPGTNVTHYSFAHLDQRTVSMSMRLNYTATPNLTFEFYGQPFVSTGTYSNFREVSSTPDAAKYDDRFVPYNLPPDQKTTFKYTQLRTNTVVRWEYRPGSTLFVVWTQGRQDDESRNLDQGWARDYRDLFALHPDNTFLIKLAYWLNR